MAAPLSEGGPRERFCRELGYAFRDPALLERALTHRSASSRNNERLEFLGDALINFVVGEALFHRCPAGTEGDLSRLRASLVCEDALAALAERLHLGDALILGGGELRSGGWRRASILADTLEAVFGALYLDAGFDGARRTCEQAMTPLMDKLPDPSSLKDAKTRLQEHLQGLGRPLPLYALRVVTGPEHAQSFTVECRLADAEDATEGRAGSRKAAEQDAADRMLRRIGVSHA